MMLIKNLYLFLLLCSSFINCYGVLRLVAVVVTTVGTDVSLLLLAVDGMVLLL